MYVPVWSGPSFALLIKRILSRLAVIEYGLLFGLGFVTALLAVFLLAPAIHRRIVKFTEDRIMATVPVSPQELRAQKDMVRAEMAASAARTGHDLKLERQKAAQLSISNDQLSLEASRVHGENADLKTEMEEMAVQASELRAGLRNEELRLDQMTQALATQERSEREKDSQIEALQAVAQRLGTDIDNLRIDLATRDTEVEGLKARMNVLRDERETLRSDIKLITQRAKDAELRLAREENRATRLEERLNAEVSGSIDKDTIIERRINEINRLKERLKNTTAEAREAVRAKPAVAAKPVVAPRVRIAAANADEPTAALPLVEAAAIQPEITIMPMSMIGDERVTELTEDVRGQAAAVSDMLLHLEDVNLDDSVRSEIADIAAKMIAIVGQKEGAGSPIHSMISRKPSRPSEDRLSLSERASKLVLRQ